LGRDGFVALRHIDHFKMRANIDFVEDFARGRHAFGVAAASVNEAHAAHCKGKRNQSPVAAGIEYRHSVDIPQEFRKPVDAFEMKAVQGAAVADCAGMISPLPMKRVAASPE